MKKTAKFASPIAIIEFAGFESKLDSINHDCVNFTEALDSNKSFTNRNQIHQIISLSLIFVDTDGNWISKNLIVVKMLVHTFSKL